MSPQEKMSESPKVNANDLQIEISSTKRVWSRPQYRRLHISYETAGGPVPMITEDSFPFTGPIS